MRRFLASLLILIGLALPCAAAVAVDSANCNQSNEQYISSVTSPQTTAATYTVTSGFSAMMVIIEIDSGTAPTISSVVWDAAGANNTLTLIGSQTGASANLYLYGAVGIAAASNKAVTITTSANTAKFYIDVCTFSGATTPVGSAFNNFTGANSTATVSVTSATGNIVAGGYSTSGSLGTPTGTTIFTSTAGAVMNGAANYASGAASVSIGSSGSVQQLAYANVVAAAGAAVCQSRSLLGVGC